MTALAVEVAPPARTWWRARLIGRSLLGFLRVDVLVALAALLVAGLVWQAISLILDAQWLPTFFHVADRAKSLIVDDPAFRDAYVQSMWQTALGFALAVILGGLLGVTMATSKLGNHAFRPYVDLLLIIPPAALAPILVAMFGLTSTNIIAIAAIFAVSVIAATTAAAVDSVDVPLVEAGMVFGLSRASMIRLVIMPAIMPRVFVGLHLGVTRAMKGMIVGQVVIGVIGIGAYEASYAQVFDSEGLWAIAMIVLLTALTLAWCVRVLDHVINYWAYRD